VARKGVRLVVVCEDDEHWKFARHAFLRLGYHNRELRPFISPSGRGAAEHWVRKRYALEVRAHRRRVASQKVGLVVVVDADTETTEHRHNQLSSELADAGLPQRTDGERIVLWIPRRHIETWVAYLLGNKVTEDEDWKRRMQGQDYRPPAYRFIELYQRSDDRPADLLPSMSLAYEELACLS